MSNETERFAAALREIQAVTGAFRTDEAEEVAVLVHEIASAALEGGPAPASTIAGVEAWGDVAGGAGGAIRAAGTLRERLWRRRRVEASLYERLARGPRA